MRGAAGHVSLVLFPDGQPCLNPGLTIRLRYIAGNGMGILNATNEGCVVLPAFRPSPMKIPDRIRRPTGRLQIRTLHSKRGAREGPSFYKSG
jgi:hypothetical protein